MKIKKILLWILSVFCIAASLTFFPSICSIFAALAGILLLPIDKWQGLIGKGMAGKIKNITAAVMATLMIITAPVTDMEIGADTTGSVETVAATGDTLEPPSETDAVLVTDEVFETDAKAETEAATLPETEWNEPYEDTVVESETEADFESETETVTEAPHIHVYSDATCTAPKTCEECGETVGDPTGHSWTNATCTSPKTCGACGVTEGYAVGHSWTNATCTSPKTCSACGVTEGYAVGHSWTNATCTSPKTCSACGVTEGYAVGHSWTNATCTSPKTCGVCGVTEGYADNHSYADGKCTYCGHGDPDYNSTPSNPGASGDGDGDDVSGNIVYRTPTGKRYHIDPQCGGKNSYQVTYQRAVSSGLTPCKKCVD